VETEHQVLVVEDDHDLRELLATILSNRGYPVIEASHGLEALGKLRTAPEVCLIVLDLFMPAMNGWEFRAAQMQDPTIADIPVVVVSADSDAVRRVRSLGVADAMTKPIDFRRLLDLVGRYC
jgi:CheY-like chemotaxis protein